MVIIVNYRKFRAVTYIWFSVQIGIDLYHVKQLPAVAAHLSG